MIDVRTGFLVATAIGTPLLLQTAQRAGVPIPVYITAGQRAALAAMPSSIAGVSTISQGAAQADTTTLYARWNTWNTTIKQSQGAATNVRTYPGHPEWTPTNFAAITPDQARAMANALIAAADAGAAVAGDEGYDGRGTENANTADGVTPTFGPIADSTPYQDIKGLLATDSTWGSDQGDAEDFAPALLALALECDQRGYLTTGKPFVPTVAGGLNAAADAVGSFVTGVAGKTLGTAANLAAGALLSTPGLILIGGLVLYKAAKR